jgi:hypothetical protein
MKIVAPIPILAESASEESKASLSLVKDIGILVLPQFLRSVGESAPFFIGTVPVLSKSLTELRFKL